MDLLDGASIARTTFETLLFAQTIEPAFKEAGAVGGYEAQAFAAALVRQLEDRHDAG
jgi:hypothetical protein